jgi:thioredoxin reductase/NAD-dependent dihydropyrimidine dehydrogenase PreA subunit
MEFGLNLLWFLVPLVGVMIFYGRMRKRAEEKSIALRAAAVEAGLVEPHSLHPKIDQSLCIGCGSCVAACPEGDVLGLIAGKAELVAPTECIGHGACRASCPVGAIELVFGTEKRGIDLPHVGPDFQTNVPGLYIAGELGGMGLIRNAIEQGRQAVEQIAKRVRPNGEDHDVIIVGAGPSGFSASLAAIEKGLRYVTLEQDSLGGTVAHYPRGKLVMTAPAQLPRYGTVKFGEISKESLLSFWTKVAKDNDLQIHFQERVDSIVPTGSGFEVVTAKRTLRAQTVLLTIGRRGSPRRLGVDGEELPKVVYRMIDAEQYAGRHVLVVGGGDSALEAAATLVEETNASVTLAYRGNALGRAKPKNRERVNSCVASKRLELWLNTEVASIADDHVVLNREGQLHRAPNDAIIVCAGGIVPTEFLKRAGVEISTKFGTS